MEWNLPSTLCSKIMETVLTASVFGPDLGALHMLRAEWDTGTDEWGSSIVTLLRMILWTIGAQIFGVLRKRVQNMPQSYSEGWEIGYLVTNSLFYPVWRLLPAYSIWGPSRLLPWGMPPGQRGENAYNSRTSAFSGMLLRGYHGGSPTASGTVRNATGWNWNKEYL